MIEELTGAAIEAAIPDLAATLHGCVCSGASVGFVLPFSLAEATEFWGGLVPHFRSGARRLLAARLDGRLVGTVQLSLAMPPNGRHRAEINKLLVHPAARRQGLARRLMLAAEALARAERRSLLILDTIVDGAGYHLYRGLGFEPAGIVPDYALSTLGALEPTCFLYKRLDTAR
jgi:ribosomal protein S18 acetylase RimI-like enzyme